MKTLHVTVTPEIIEQFQQFDLADQEHVAVRGHHRHKCTFVFRSTEEYHEAQRILDWPH